MKAASVQLLISKNHGAYDNIYFVQHSGTKFTNVWNPLNNGLKKKSFLKNWNNLKFPCYLNIIFFIFYFYHRPDYVDLKYFITLFSLWFTASTSPASELKKQALGRSNSVGIIENIHTKAIQSSPLAGEIHYGKRKHKLKKNCLRKYEIDF